MPRGPKGEKRPADTVPNSSAKFPIDRIGCSDHPRG
jgi:hypothetical protein